MRHDAQQQVRMREKHADAQRTDPSRFDLPNLQCAFNDDQQSERSENECDIKRDAIAPFGPLPCHQNGQEDDGALGEPLEESLEAQAAIISCHTFSSKQTQARHPHSV
jgi:hypothetical protein